MFSILFYLILQNINCNIQSNGAGLQHNRLSKFINADMSSTMSGYSPTSAIHFVECFSNYNAEHRTRNAEQSPTSAIHFVECFSILNAEHGTQNTEQSQTLQTKKRSKPKSASLFFILESLYSLKRMKQQTKLR